MSLPKRTPCPYVLTYCHRVGTREAEVSETFPNGESSWNVSDRARVESNVIGQFPHRIK